MLRQERVEDQAESLRLALLGWQSGMYTMLPGILDSVNFAKNTCEVQPAVQAVWRLKDGKDKVVTLPLCLDVPVLFLGGGGYTLTFPLAKGDEGAIFFASRCIDAWWQNGGVQPQAELRMHDLSDGFFVPGFRCVPRALANISTTSVQLRADDGSSYVDIAAAKITLKHPTKVVVDSPAVQFTGDVTMDKKLTVSDLTLIGGGGQFVKLADGSNATKLKAT